MPIGVYQRQIRRMPNHPFYQRIQQRLNEKGITLAKAYEDTGISPNCFIDYNATCIKMRGYNIISVAEYLGVTISWLMEGEE